MLTAAEPLRAPPPDPDRRAAPPIGVPAAPIAEAPSRVPRVPASTPGRASPPSQDIVNHPLVRKAVELFADRTPDR